MSTTSDLAPTAGGSEMTRTALWRRLSRDRVAAVAALTLIVVDRKSVV